MVSIAIGIIGGNGAVYAFNKLPASWLCDYGKEPSEAAKSLGTQRIKSYPWKYVFTASFIVVAIYMGINDWQYAIAGIIGIWLLLEIAIADKKYMIIPDQLVMFLAITGFGFIPFQGGFMDLVEGVILGGCVMLAVALVGKFITKKDVAGIGDVKLCAAVGLATGPYGIGFTIICGAFICGIVAAILLLMKKIKKDDEIALGPYLCGAAIIYIVILHNYFN